VTVDEFVKSKVEPEFRPLVAAVRKLIKETAPGAKEAISYGIPMYGSKKPIAWITPGKTGISVGFREGASFKDRYSQLRGVGKHARNVRLKKLEDLNKTALSYYIKQAVKLDKP
jgi:hypothetical protein